VILIYVVLISSECVKAVFDIDPGIDDAIELLLALNDPDVEVLAVTTMSGNVSLGKATTNALRIIEASGKRVPVYPGASKPLKRIAVRAGAVHGIDGLGEISLPFPVRRPEKTHAVDMLLELSRTHKKKEIAILTTGPLTNIASLFRKDPSLAKNLRTFVMGGIYDPTVKGNVSKYAEFNFYADPEAADIVMGSGASIVASGLDVTTSPDCAVGPELFSKICSSKSPAGQIACRLLSYPMRRSGHFHLHDVFALFSLLYPEMFATQKLGVRVDTKKFRGRCLLTQGGDIRVCRKVDHRMFTRRLLGGL
jgi:inosine-uridine nucleoside N-ribohydrolase